MHKKDNKNYSENLSGKKNQILHCMIWRGMNENFLIEYKQVPVIRVNVIKFRNSLAPYFEQTENEHFIIRNFM